MPLHAKLGIVNLQFDTLDEFLEMIGSPIRAIDWAIECGLIQQAYYGGKVQFNGNGCSKLLNSIDKLYKLLLDNDLQNRCQPFLKNFEAFNAVVKSCFGNFLFENRYKDDIRYFANTYFNLIGFCQNENQKLPPNSNKKLKLTVRPKVHDVFVHITQFLDNQKNRGFANFGLGFYSEQAGETLHKDYELLRTGSSLKRNMIHPQYDDFFLKCTDIYNSRNSGATE